MSESKHQEQLTFEQAMARLEVIVKQLEQGNAPLEEALSLFEEGTALMNRCASELNEAELKVSQLMPGAGGKPVLQPLPEKETEA